MQILSLRSKFQDFFPILLFALSLLVWTQRAVSQTGIFPTGGRHLYLHYEGQRQGPAVILDAGLFRDSTDWRLVQPEVARFTRVCSYDREGLGQSVVDKGAKPETECADQQLDDLKNLLKAAQVDPPYVLVGHSGGGPRVRRYTRKYPDNFAGLVFVDSAHEERVWKFQAIDPRSVQGPPADPEKVKCGGGLPYPGERAVPRSRGYGLQKIVGTTSCSTSRRLWSRLYGMSGRKFRTPAASTVKSA